MSEPQKGVTYFDKIAKTGGWEYRGIDRFHGELTYHFSAGYGVNRYMKMDHWKERFEGPQDTKDARIAELTAQRDELLVACKSMLPKNACLTNKNIPDTMLVSFDITYGELRAFAAAIAAAKGKE